MSETKGNSTASRDRVLVAVAAMQLLTLAAVWGDRPGGGGLLPTSASPAQGQIANAGDQRARQLDALDAIDRKLERLLDVLEGGRLQVVVAGDAGGDRDAGGDGDGGKK